MADHSHAAHAAGHQHDHGHGGVGKYLMVFLALCVLTVISFVVANSSLMNTPLVGWAMLSAGGYPVMLGDSLRLPPIFPASATAFAILRHLHTWLALLLFLTFLAHMAAALYHGLIGRDGVLASMLPAPPTPADDSDQA